MSDLSSISSPEAGPSEIAVIPNKSRASSIISLSSSLSDPEETDDEKEVWVTSTDKPPVKSGKSTASEDETDLDDELEDDDDDDIVEIGQDGEVTPITRIKALLNKPPNEPKHRWETAYVYAFVERFTDAQKDSAHTPQTIQEFEKALIDGSTPKLPESAEDEWLPSLEPIFKDFIERLKNQDKLSGGSGGIRGGWLMWLPWWINEQKKGGLPDFNGSGWNKVINALREDKNGIWDIDWDKKLIILKVLVDAQLCIVKEVKQKIDESYKYGLAGIRLEKQQKDATSKSTSAEAPKKEGKADKSTNQTEKEQAQTKEAENTLVIRPMGEDTRHFVWYQIDDSPRLYVNNRPYSSQQNFVTVADSVEEIKDILKHLSKPKPGFASVKAEASAKSKSKDNPFSKAAKINGKTAAMNGKAKEQKAPKKPKLTRKEKALLAEQALYTHISSFVIPALTSEDSPFLARVARFTNRRANILKKKDREARSAQLAAERAALEELRAQGISTGIRSSTRLRRGARPDSFGYNESARDEEFERAIKESERGRRKRRRTSDESDGESDYDDSRANTDSMDVDNDDNEFDTEDDDDSHSGKRRRRSGKYDNQSRRPTIPGERRSQRARTQVVTSGYRPEDFSREASPERSNGRATIIRSYSPNGEAEEDDEEDAPFGGLEEIWSKGKYLGFYTVGREFIKAKPGDIPLYKLIRMGKPLPDPHTGKFAEETETEATGEDGEPKVAEKSLASAIDKTESTLNPNANADATSNGHAAGDIEGNSSVPSSAVPTLEPDEDLDDKDNKTRGASPASTSEGDSSRLLGDLSRRSESPGVTVVASRTTTKTPSSVKEIKIDLEENGLSTEDASALEASLGW